MEKLFGSRPKCFISKNGNSVVYFGSTVLVRWFLAMGLRYNKVKDQVDVPRWIFSKNAYMGAAIRGLIDTDGSVYRLKFGMQISFCNHSKPLLQSARKMLLELGYHPSKINGQNIYITRREDLKKYFTEIGFNNLKHRERLLAFQKNNGCVA